MSAKDRQEGGSHYKDFVIQPIDFVLKNKLPFVEGCVIKYVCRHADKNGAEDIRKAIHYLELLLEEEYGEDEAIRGEHPQMELYWDYETGRVDATPLHEAEGSQQVQPEWYAQRDPFFKHESDGTGEWYHCGTESDAYDNDRKRALFDAGITEDWPYGDNK